MQLYCPSRCQLTSFRCVTKGTNIQCSRQNNVCAGGHAGESSRGMRTMCKHPVHKLMDLISKVGTDRCHPERSTTSVVQRPTHPFPASVFVCHHHPAYVFRRLSALCTIWCQCRSNCVGCRTVRSRRSTYSPSRSSESSRSSTPGCRTAGTCTSLPCRSGVRRRGSRTGTG